MSAINPTSHSPISAINVRVIRITHTENNAAMDADVASSNTENKILASKRKVDLFRNKTNRRVERIHCQQARQQYQRQIQLTKNFRSFAPNCKAANQDKAEFDDIFSKLLTPTKSIKFSDDRGQTKRTRNHLIWGNQQKYNMQPFWARGFRENNQLGQSEEKQLFVAIRKWNMVRDRNNIQQPPTAKKIRSNVKVISHRPPIEL